MDFQKHTLNNGLRVVTAPMSAMESATVQILIGSGSRDENVKKQGLAHFLEHMVFKGTKKYPTSAVISAAVDGIGGEINASTGKERTGYYIKAWERYLSLAFDILSQFISAPILKEREIEKEKGVIIEEIAMYEDLPMYKAPYLFEELLFDKTSLGWDVAGTPETIRTMEKKDFEGFIADYYQPENMVLSVAGKFDQSEVLKLAQKYFGKLGRSKLDVRNGKLDNEMGSGKSHLARQSEANPVSHFSPRISKLNPSKKPEIRMVNKKTEQAHIVLGVRGNRLGHPDRYKEAVLASILGGGMSSWLWNEIREKRGLAYYVRCDIDHYKDTGYIAARAGVKLDSVEEAIEVILAQFNKISTPGKVKDRELTKAKEYLKGRLALGLEDTHSVSEFFGDQELFEEEVRTVEQVMAGIDAVTMSDVHSLANGFFTTPKLNLAVVGPFVDTVKFQKLLKL
ncbi:MAG: Uncharacterized protein G01um10145_851 [Microgenomates group bacterium Gr01-1014_5]|nr:MAG: Uncharacterized protein G01um10145_851 [Microgenomates group bacterium Gr01-1014_5]